MASSSKEQNLLLDGTKKDFDRKNKREDHEEERNELAWTNSTELKFRATKTYADKFLH